MPARTLNDFTVTDDVTDNLATYNNRYLGSMFSADNTNTESITATKELADNDCIYQVITTDGSAIELPPEADTNHPHLIYNTSAANTLPVKDDSGTTTFLTLSSDEWALFMPVEDEGWKVVATKINSYPNNIIRGIVRKTAVPDNSATGIFTITTTNETGDVDAGSYSCLIKLNIGHNDVVNSGDNSAKFWMGSFSRAMKNNGTGVNSAVNAITSAASAATNSAVRDISTVTVTVTETSEYVMTVNVQVDLTGSAASTAIVTADIELIYSTFTTPPVIAAA